MLDRAVAPIASRNEMTASRRTGEVSYSKLPQLSGLKVLLDEKAYKTPTNLFDGFAEVQAGPTAAGMYRVSFRPHISPERPRFREAPFEHLALPLRNWYGLPNSKTHVLSATPLHWVSKRVISATFKCLFWYPTPVRVCCGE